MSKKLFLVVAILLGAIIGLWAWTFAAPNNSLSIGGSASVDPLLQQLTNNYKKEKKESFIYSSTGSGAGVKNVQNDVYNAGFISKEFDEQAFDSNEYNIYDDNEKFFQVNENGLNAYGTQATEQGYLDYIKANMSEDKEDIHHIEFAKDSIVFIYNIEGTNFEDFVEYFEFGVKTAAVSGAMPTLSDDSIDVLKAIYEPNNPNDLITWRHLAEMIIEKLEIPSTKTVSQSEIAKLKLALPKVANIKVNPYTTTPGSGTRSSFEKITKKSNEKEGITPGRAANAYGNNGSIFSQIQRSNGSIGYVSMAYAEYVQDAEKFNDLKAVVINDGVNQYDVNKESTSDIEGVENTNDLNNYPLVRPFIAIYKAQNKNIEAIAKFLFWMATDPKAGEFYKHEGLMQVIK
ncbi:phosphate ABC transporter substrate-binding protein [[Acholeplasma] multilocale]|uniref:phosphate ABC transporter substrate-binding protein n=1 Tax=[Acholeplasma] multilocale TaxID=264638 RepID=UPI00047DB9BD|nr:phosphate ABC transporter substrate-binding protein [[Acholeplasma] multilocale]